jgi:hypothetical protein
MSESVLTSARYGKDLVRVFRVVKGKEFHQVVEHNVTVLLEGDIETRSVTHYHEPHDLILHIQLHRCRQLRRRHNRF